MSFLPEHQPFSGLSKHLIEAYGWSGFLVPGLSESQQTETMAGLLASGDRQKLALKNVADRGGANHFVAESKSFCDAYTHLSKHSTRTTHESLRAYIGRIAQLIESFYARPAYAIHRLLNEHCRTHIRRLLEDLQCGDYCDELTGTMLEDLDRKLRKNVAEGLIRTGTSGIYEAADNTHDSFIRAFSKEFKVEVHHWDPLAEGVTIYLDQWNHNKMEGEIPDLNTVLERVADKHGYLMLRRGQQADIDFGSFPEPTSRWLFVKSSSAEDQKLGGIEVLSRTTYAPIPLKNE